MRKLEAREIWNDSIGLILCIAGLVGIGMGVAHSGWLIFLGACFFFAP